jgi:hypothetical protein
MDTVKQIIDDLSAFGMNDASIAAEVDSTQPTIWRIRTGATKACSSVLYSELSILRDRVRKTKRSQAKEAA